MYRSRLIIILFFIAVSTQTAFSQASLVPVYHQVYDWLHYQRVRGNAPLYNYEALPLTRGQITQLLADIDPNELNKGDRHVRQSYLREFSVDSLRSYKNNTLIQGNDRVYNRLKKLLFSDDELHIYVWNDENSKVAIDVSTTLGALYIEDNNLNYSAPYFHQNVIRSYGSYNKFIGFHYEQWLADGVGDHEALNYKPFLSRNWKALSGSEWNKGHFEAYAGFNKNIWSFHVGRGTLKYGTGQTNNLVFSREGIPFDWVRLNINSKYFKYSLIHGSLSWKTKTTELTNYPGNFTRTAPNRFLVHQKLTFQPFHWISFSIYELINYSNRDIELAYLNPVTRLSYMEWELQDLDNGWLGFEGVIRPYKGLEFFGELLIDDLGTLTDVFKWSNKLSNSTFVRYLGGHYSFKTGTTITSTYQRVEPAAYAHKFVLNSHAEKGIGLGSQVGPNGDELSLKIEQWLSHRIRFQVLYSYNRHGFNYTNDNGEFIDVGGDIIESYTYGSEKPNSNGFLAGNLNRWNKFEISATYNPWRSIRLGAMCSVRKNLEGQEIQDLLTFEFNIQLGY